MAKAKGGQAAAKEAKSGKVIVRKRRNSFERKCLPKALKNLFKGDSRAQFRSLLKAWQDSRKRVSAKDAE